MKTTLRYLAPALAAAALGAAIVTAPAAVAEPASQHPTPTSAAAPTAPGEDGSDPLVPTNTGANPFVFVPQGDELPG